MKKSVNFDRLIFIVLSMLIFFIPFREILAYYTSSIVKSIPDLLIFVLFVSYIIKVRFRIKIDKIDLFFLLYLILEAISTILINHVGLKAYIVQVRSISLYYFLFYILKNYKLSEDSYQNIIPILKSILYVLFVLAIIEKLFAKTVLFPEEWRTSIIYFSNYIRTYGMFNSPNTYAAFILFSFIYVYQLTDNFWIRKNFLFIFVCICSLLLTVSRSTLILFMFFVIVLSIAQWYIKKHKNQEIHLISLKPFLICLLGAVVAWGGAEAFSNYYLENVVYANGESSSSGSLDRFNELFDEKIITSSQSNGRLYGIKKGLEIVKDHPIFGTGFGTYGSSASLICGSPIYKEYDIEDNFYADNEYIKIFVEGGILGLFAFVAFLASVLYTYRRSLFKILVCVIMGGLGLFYNIFEVQILSFLFWLVTCAPMCTDLKIGDMNYEHS